MNDTILAAIIGVGGAVIAAVLAAFGTVYLTSTKEKEKQQILLKLHTNSLISIIENSILPQIVHLQNNIEEASSILVSDNNISIMLIETHAFEINLLDVIDRDTLLMVFEDKAVSPSDFFNILVLMKRFQNKNTNTILSDYENSEKIIYNKRFQNKKNNSVEYSLARTKYLNDLQVLRHHVSSSLEELDKSCTKAIEYLSTILIKLKA